jgi:hypothetical protein
MKDKFGSKPDGGKKTSAHVQCQSVPHQQELLLLQILILRNLYMKFYMRNIFRIYQVHVALKN